MKAKQRLRLLCEVLAEPDQLPKDSKRAYDELDLMTYAKKSGKGSRKFHGIEVNQKNMPRIIDEIRVSFEQTSDRNDHRRCDELQDYIDWDYGKLYYVKSNLTELFYRHTLTKVTDTQKLIKLIYQGRIYV